MSYGVFALVVLIELYALRMQRLRVLEEAKRMEEGMDVAPDGSSIALPRDRS